MVSATGLSLYATRVFDFFFFKQLYLQDDHLHYLQH